MAASDQHCVLKSSVLAHALIVQAYGIVWKAVDKKTRDVIALKKIFDAFQNSTDAQVRCVPINELCITTRRQGCV